MPSHSGVLIMGYEKDIWFYLAYEFERLQKMKSLLRKDEICYADEIQAGGLDEIKSTHPV